MEQPKEYKIVTISDMLDCVTEENLDNFLIDLRSFIKTSHNMFYLARTIDPSLKDMKNSEIGEATFNWIDDGKHEARNGAIVHNNESGETLEFPLDIEKMNEIAEFLKQQKI